MSPDTWPRIGPNAVIRVAEALRERDGDAILSRVFADAGLERYLASPPEAMVDEREVTRLHAALRAALGEGAARAVLRDAGLRTGDYLLAHRIPRPVQAVLKRLPARLASRVLLGAIGKHAWTFAGSGHFDADAGKPMRFAIAGCPLCRDAHASAPICDYYAGTFERLYRTLVHPQARASETHCEARGDDACRFEVVW